MTSGVEKIYGTKNPHFHKNKNNARFIWLTEERKISLSA